MEYFYISCSPFFPTTLETGPQILHVLLGQIVSGRILGGRILYFSSCLDIS